MKPVEALWEVEKPTKTKAPTLEPEQTATLVQTSRDVYGILIDLAHQLPNRRQALIAGELQELETLHTLAHEYVPDHPDHTLPKSTSKGK